MAGPVRFTTILVLVYQTAWPAQIRPRSIFGSSSIGRSSASFTVENLLNTQYLPVYSHLLRSGTNKSRVPANGATLTIGYKRNW